MEQTDTSPSLYDIILQNNFFFLKQENLWIRLINNNNQSNFKGKVRLWVTSQERNKKKSTILASLGKKVCIKSAEFQNYLFVSWNLRYILYILKNEWIYTISCRSENVKTVYSLFIEVADLTQKEKSQRKDEEQKCNKDSGFFNCQSSLGFLSTLRTHG